MKKSKMDGMEVEIEIEKEEPKKIEEYEIEQALEDFMRVAKHKKNAKLMEMIMGKADEKKKAIESLDDLKQAKADFFTKKSKG